MRLYWLPCFFIVLFMLISVFCPMPSGAQSGITDFQSVQELKEFLAQDNTDNHIYLTANSNGVVRFKGVCNEYAMQLRDRALEKGKYLSVTVVSRLEYYLRTHRIMDEGANYHTMCLAIIGREYFLIEPKTDEIWLSYKMP
jgi:hypothetical protein